MLLNNSHSDYSLPRILRSFIVVQVKTQGMDLLNIIKAGLAKTQNKMDA